MLYRNIARLGILVLKLHVNAVQSSVNYNRIYKKNFPVTMGIKPATYVLNHNISVVLPCLITLSQLLLKQIRKYDTTVGLRSCGKYKILDCVYRTLSLVLTGYKKMSIFKLESYSDRANCFGSLGR